LKKDAMKEELQKEEDLKDYLEYAKKQSFQ
jgi:hypothetical protein